MCACSVKLSQQAIVNVEEYLKVSNYFRGDYTTNLPIIKPSKVQFHILGFVSVPVRKDLKKNNSWRL